MKKLLKAVCVMAMVLGLAGGAYAGSTSGDMYVDATALSGLILRIDSNVNFGIFDNSSAGTVSGTGQIAVIAQNGLAYTVSMDAGRNYSGTSRQVTDGIGSYLAYNLYQDAAHTIAWDTGYGDGSNLAGTGTGVDQIYTVHGLLTTDPTANDGHHQDIILVTAIW